MSIYNVSINALNKAAPSDGFIDNMTVEDYMKQGADATSLATSQAKSRANQRFKNIVSAFMPLSTFTISVFSATGNTVDTAPSNIVLQFSIDKNDASITTPDENNAGATLTGIAAIKRIIARTMLRNDSFVLNVYDPTKTTAPGNSTTAERRGTRFETTAIGPCAASLSEAEGVITVTKLT